MSSFFGLGDEDPSQMKQQQASLNPPAAAPADSTQTTAAPVKKKRNLPGTPSKYLNTLVITSHASHTHSAILL